MSLGSAGEKFELCITSTYLVEFIDAEYFREIDITSYLSLMFIRTLTALKKSSKKKETENKRKWLRYLNMLVTVERKQGSKKL